MRSTINLKNMEPISEEVFFSNLFKRQKEGGLEAVVELGQRIIDRAKWCEETEAKLPFLIADFESLRFHVKLVYKGVFDNTMTFVLLDMLDPYYGVHGYIKEYYGDTEAFFMELIREMAYIYSLHFPSENE